MSFEQDDVVFFVKTFHRRASILSAPVLQEFLVVLGPVGGHFRFGADQGDAYWKFTAYTFGGISPAAPTTDDDYTFELAGSGRYHVGYLVWAVVRYPDDDVFAFYTQIVGGRYCRCRIPRWRRF